jgi:subfamily B ATP-binding cassette protein MsbA
MSYKNLPFLLIERYPFRVFINILLSFSGALFNGISTTLIVPILISLMGQDAILRDGPPLIRYLLEPFDNLPSGYRLGAMLAAVVLAIVLKNLANYATSLASNALSRKATSDLQEEGLRLLFEVDLVFFVNARAGDLMNRLGGEISRASSTITAMIRLISHVITILVFLIILLSLSWQLTLVAAILLPISTLISQQLVKRSRQLGRRITNINQEYSGGLIEVFSGIRLVKATSMEEAEFKRFSKLIREREKAHFQSQMIAAAIAPIGEMTNLIILLILIMFGRILFADQLAALSAVLLTYLVVLFRMLPFIGQLNSAREALARSSASVEVVDDLMRRDNKTFMSNGTLQYTGLRQQIQIEELSFAYPDSSEMALQDINLTIPKGTTLALVGSSGAGKSTLADLLPRFYDPTAGRITLDGIDVRDFDIRSLHQGMGIVSQDTFLFNDTVRYNITYGCPEATEADILDAIKRANAYEFIMRLPEGLETMIGDRGIMLSGGQRQRIAIARALLRDPEILVLDEATSALDTISERLVQTAIDELSRERTTLVIAHRLSTIQRADQIAVMEKGRVVELGTHEELLQRGGHYSDLYRIQFSHASQAAISAVEGQKQEIGQISYEFRSRLNAILGSLNFLANDMADSPEERTNLLDQAYRLALEMFKTVRYLESLEKVSSNLIASQSMEETEARWSEVQEQENIAGCNAAFREGND